MQFFQHDVGEEEIEAIAQAIREGHLTTGGKLKEFSRALEEAFGFPKVELCSSGTSALQLTLFALGIGPGDEVITTPYVGVWTPNTILMNGATPVFADIDRGTYNLDPASVAARLTDKTKAVMPVSVNGNPCDLRGLRAVLPDHVRIVCDDIEALGSRRKGKFVGADIGSDISVNGFWVSKQVTTCGGGMVTSEDREFLVRFEKLTRHGHGLVGDMWEQTFGFNAWLSDPMAAMGVVQIKRLMEKQDRLVRVKAMLDVHFGKDRKQVVRDGDFQSEFIYLIELPDGVDKRRYAEAMATLKVPTRPYFNSLLEVPHLRHYASDCPVNDVVCKKTIALPYHWKLTQEEIDEIVDAHKRVLG
jgi:perosamine synthetase